MIKQQESKPKLNTKVIVLASPTGETTVIEVYWLSQAVRYYITTINEVRLSDPCHDGWITIPVLGAILHTWLFFMIQPACFFLLPLMLRLGAFLGIPIAAVFSPFWHPSHSYCLALCSLYLCQCCIDKRAVNTHRQKPRAWQQTGCVNSVLLQWWLNVMWEAYICPKESNKIYSCVRFWLFCWNRVSSSPGWPRT